MVGLLNLASLDESAGEGYHRATNGEATRAHGCKMMHLKGTVRHKQNLAKCKRFLRSNDALGRKIFRYEWKHWKRIMQVGHRYRWRSVQKKRKLVLKRVYREDVLGDDDWSAMTSRLEPDRPVVAQKPTPTEALYNEWLVATLRPNSYYSCELREERPTPEGGVEQHVVTRVFQVIDVIHSHGRPELMHTAASADDVVLAAPVALSVQHYDVYGGPAVADDGTMLVYPEGDLEWVQPARLAPIAVMLKEMLTWPNARPSTDVEQVIVLSGQTRAVPVWPLEDERCPVLTLAQALEAAGWTGQQQLVRHVDAGARVYDSRNSTRMRWYFRLLHHGLDRCLPLAGGTVPSQEPMAFYRLLIEGVPCRPGLPATTYQAALNDRRRRHGQELVPLPPHEQPPPIAAPPGDATTITLPGEDEGEDQCGRRRGGGGQGPLRGGAGRGLRGRARRGRPI